MSLITITESLQQKITIPVKEQSNIQSIYVDLIECILQHNQRYYQDSDPIISDYEYDKLFDYLKKIEESHSDLISPESPTQTIQGQDVVQDAFTKANHLYPLLSLENSYDAQDIHDRSDRLVRILAKEDITESLTYTIQPKYDGISVAITYEDGHLTQAITRGDGQTGDDITLNIKTIANLPHTINHTGTLIVRGEIMLPKSELNRINTTRESQGLASFANTRNVASGTIKLLDTSIVRGRKLVCYTYDILTETQDRVSLESLGLPTHQANNLQTTTYTNIEEVSKACLDQSIKSELDNADIDFDGLVIKVISPHLREALGSTDHHPRRAIAYKYPAQQVTTTIESIDYQVGRTGTITPVANLAPVELSGVTISRASLHNFDFITSKDIRLHDRVRIQRSGEVIPYIVGVVKDARPEDAAIITKPIHCPDCDHPAVYDDIYVRCPNTHGCPAQRKERIKHFVSKQCMDIDGLGKKYVDILVDNGFISNIADLYTLHTQDHALRSLPGFGDKRVDQILTQIEESKTKSLRRLFNALSLPSIGKKLAKELEKALASENKEANKDSLTYLKGYLTKTERLTAIYGIGDTIVEDMRHFFTQEENTDTLERLASYGICFLPEEQKKGPETSVTGLHFSLTGSLGLPRPKIVEILEGRGAILDSSPTKSTDFMLVGDKPGSKAQKARDMGLTIFSSLNEITTTHPDITFPEIKKESKKPQQTGLFG